jgi:hypothetical protein
MVWLQVWSVHCACWQQVLLPLRQVKPAPQAPQSTVPPQPLEMVPQLPTAQVAGVQHWWPTQTSLPGQVAQVTVLPQLSLTEPHSAPWSAQPSGWQQLLPWQRSPGAQLPPS